MYTTAANVMENLVSQERPHFTVGQRGKGIFPPAPKIPVEKPENSIDDEKSGTDDKSTLENVSEGTMCAVDALQPIHAKAVEDENREKKTAVQQEDSPQEQEEENIPQVPEGEVYQSPPKAGTNRPREEQAQEQEQEIIPEIPEDEVCQSPSNTENNRPTEEQM